MQILNACLSLLGNFDVRAGSMLGKSMNLLLKLIQCSEINAQARSMLGNLMFVYSLNPLYWSLFSFSIYYSKITHCRKWYLVTKLYQTVAPVDFFVSSHVFPWWKTPFFTRLMSRSAIYQKTWYTLQVHLCRTELRLTQKIWFYYKIHNFNAIIMKLDQIILSKFPNDWGQSQMILYYWKIPTILRLGRS